MRRKFLLLSIDLLWVALSPFVALLIRDSFHFREGVVPAAAEYAGIATLIAAAVFLIIGLHRDLWRYTSLPNLIRLAVAAAVIVLLSLFACFSLSRAEGIARSIPVVQWFVLVALMGGTRIAIRLWWDRRRRPKREPLGTDRVEHILLVGVNQVAELYARAVEEFAPHRVSIMGILVSGEGMSGRLLRSLRVLGRPEEIAEVVRQLEIHGALIERVVVAEPAAQLSPEALETLLKLERASTIRVEWVVERLGLDRAAPEAVAPNPAPALGESVASKLARHASAPRAVFTYERAKRALDFVGAALLLIVLAPVLVLLAIATAIDVGWPLVFWQWRPGRNGYPFKLYKFRTMRGAHDTHGNRIPDGLRSSLFGAFVRGSRLDELPQLYNVLIGEMSFIGPRPLLQGDHGRGHEVWQRVRPGLTGWAQVSGGRLLDPDDKAALDGWYVENVSLLLDLRIALKTWLVLGLGDRVDEAAIDAARGSGRVLPSQPLVSARPVPGE